MGILFLIPALLVIGSMGPWSDAASTAMACALVLLFLLEVARGFGLALLLPRCPQAGCGRRAWGPPETVHGVHARRCTACAKSLLYADDADMAVALGPDGLPMGRFRLRWPWYLGRWRPEPAPGRPLRWFFTLFHRVVFGGLAAVELGFAYSLCRMDDVSGVPWNALGAALLMSPFVAILYLIVTGLALTPLVHNPALRRQGWPFLAGDRVRVLSGPHRGRLLRVNRSIPQGGVLVDLEGKELFLSYEDVCRESFAGQAGYELVPGPAGPPADVPLGKVEARSRGGIVFADEEVVFPPWRAADCSGYLLGLPLFAGFYGFMAACLAVTLHGLLSEPGRASLIAFAAAWAVFGPVVMPDLAALRWRPRALLGGLLDFALLGRAPLALRRAGPTGRPALVLERRLPLGLVFLEEALPLDEMRPVTAFPLPLYAASEVLPLVVAFGSSDGKRRGLRLANDDATLLVRTLRRWARQGQAVPASLRALSLAPEGQTPTAVAAAFSPDRKRLGGLGRGGSLWLADLADSKPVEFARGWDRVSSLVFSSDGGLLANGGSFGETRVWEVPGGKLVATLKEPCGACHGRRDTAAHGHAWCVEPLGNLADIYAEMAGEFVRTLRSWVGAGKEAVSEGLGVRLVFSPDERTRGVSAVAFAPGGKLLASAGFHRDIWLWGLPGGERLAPLAKTGQRQPALAFSPDGKTLASADRTVRLWDVQSRTAAVTLEGRMARVTRVLFSPDGATLAAVCCDGTARLWRLPGARPAARLVGPRAALWSAAFSPDGARLAAGAGDGMVWVWDVRTGERLAAFEGHGGRVLSVAFAPDGATLLSAASDAEVREWRLTP